MNKVTICIWLQAESETNLDLECVVAIGPLKDKLLGAHLSTNSLESNPFIDKEHFFTTIPMKSNTVFQLITNQKLTNENIELLQSICAIFDKLKEYQSSIKTQSRNFSPAPIPNKSKSRRAKFLLIAFFCALLGLMFIKIPHQLSFLATLHSVTLPHFAPITGTIIKLNVQKGDLVKANTLIAQMDTTTLQLAINTKSLELEELKNQLYQYKLAQDIPQFHAYEQKYKSLELEIFHLQEKISSLEIRAKQDGVIEKLYKLEEGIHLKEGTLVALLALENQYRLTFQVPQNQMIKIKKDQKIIIPALTNLTKGPEIESIYPDKKNGWFIVNLIVNGSIEPMRSNMIIWTNIQIGKESIWKILKEKWFQKI